MYNRLRTLPVEWYVLVSPFLFFTGFVAVWRPDALGISSSLTHSFFAVAAGFFGMLILAVLLLSLYLLVRFMYQLGQSALHGRNPTTTIAVDRTALLSIGKIALLYGPLVLAQATFLGVIANLSTWGDVYAFSYAYTEWDFWVFGEFGVASPLAFTNTYPWMQSVTAVVYGGLGTVSGFVALCTLLHSVRLFRGFVLSMYMTLLLSLPLWYLTPAVSPSHYLLEGVLGPVAALQHQALGDSLVEALPLTTERFQAEYWLLVDMWGGLPLTENVEQTFAISTNPSFHTALGLLCAVFAWRVWRPFGVFLGVYQLFNIFATVLLLQHYSIDILTGLSVAVLALIFSRNALLFEQRRLPDVEPPKYFAALYFVHRLGQRAWRRVIGVVARWRPEV